MFRNDGFSSFPYLLIGIGVGKVVSKGKEWIGRQSESNQSAIATRKPSHEQI